MREHVHMARRSPTPVRHVPLGYDELDALERELVDDVIAAIASAKRRFRPDYRTPPAPGRAEAPAQMTLV